MINIFALAPLGIYLPVLRKANKPAVHMVFIFIFGLFIELVQGVFKLGAPDIDDIILYCLGGFLGLILYKILLNICKNEYQVRIFTAIASTVIGIPLVIALLILWYGYR